MATMKELRDSGKMRPGTYNAFGRNMIRATGKVSERKYNERYSFTKSEFDQLTPTDILNAYSEKYILTYFRTVGIQRLNELKGLQ